MADKKPKTGVMDIEIGRTGFSFFHPFRLGKSEESGFKEVSELRTALNNEKARIMHAVKNNNPESVYKLAKILGRDFQSVRKDVLLLQKLGFLSLEKEYGKHGKRRSLRPVLSLDKLQINIVF